MCENEKDEKKLCAIIIAISFPSLGCEFQVLKR